MPAPSNLKQALVEDDQQIGIKAGKVVPYQQERRGLSPIQSVSGYTEGESDIHHRRDSRATHSELSSPDKSSTHEHRPHSTDSVPSNMRSREFGDEDGSLRSSGHYRDTRYTDDSELDRQPVFASRSPGRPRQHPGHP